MDMACSCGCGGKCNKMRREMKKKTSARTRDQGRTIRAPIACNRFCIRMCNQFPQREKEICLSDCMECLGAQRFRNRRSKR